MKRKSLAAIIICLMMCGILAGCAASSAASLTDKPESTGEDTSAADDVTDGDEPDEDEPEDDESDGGNIDEQEDWESITDYEKLYAPVFDEVSEVLHNGFDYDMQYDYVSDGLMERVMYPGEEDLLDDVGYVMEDVSGDGIPELMIGYNEPFDAEGIERSFVLGVYTLSDGEPCTVISGWARNRYWPLPDGHLYNSGSSGASNTAFGENHLSKDGTEVIWDDFYFSEENASGGLVFFHNTSGIWDRSGSERMDIPERKFGSIMDGDEEQCILFPWTPMRDYEGSGSGSLISEDIDQTAITDGMIIPDSDSRKLSEDDLKGLDKDELRIARNEIYARHGRKFADRKLQEHFDKTEWYFGTIDPGDFDESTLSAVELYNLDLIGRYEKKEK